MKPLDSLLSGSSYEYGYEYQGPKTSFITTGLTERVQYSLLMAMKDYRLGTVMGPSGVGKTETVLSLSKILGTAIFPLTCSSQFDLFNLQRILSGVVQSGCWALFDNSDRLTVELMSVAAQQLRSISMALRSLRYSQAFEYTTRGMPVTEQPLKLPRRNSLTTLHTLPQDEGTIRPTKTPRLLSQVNTFIPEQEKTTDSVSGSERKRRHSIGEGSSLKESEIYKESPLPSLFYDNVPSQKASFEAQKEGDNRHLVSQPIPYQPRYLGDIMYGGRLIPARDNSAFFMVFNSDASRYQEVPESLRLLMRPCAMVAPDRRVLIETLLYSWGYENPRALTDKLLLFSEFCQNQIGSFRLSLKSLLQALQLSVERLYSPAFDRRQFIDSSEDEFLLPKPDKYEVSLVYGFSAILLPLFEKESDLITFRNILRDIFPLSAEILPSVHHSELVQAIKDQLRTDGLHESHEIMEKILQLYSALQQNLNVIVCGPAGSGKTVIYKTLCLALNRIHARKNEARVSQLSEEIQPSKPLTTFRQNLPKAYNFTSPTLPIDHHSPFRSYPTSHPITPLASNMHSLWPVSARSSNSSTLLSTSASEVHAEVFPRTADIIKFLKSLEAREKSQLIKKWGNVSRSFARLGSLHALVKDPEAEVVYPKVHIMTLCPSAMSEEELFGHSEEGVWRDGALTHLLRSIHRHVTSAQTFTQLYSEKKAKTGVEEPSVIDNWLVLDGEMSTHWVDGLSSMMDSNRKLTLANSESIESTSECGL
ncbi:cytoplasmic dynein 1 heavy chain 1-like [Watersipora subatra]|uniref:cytoplasmic dynein 1 heavy chain 1-like n=1 Tax=Watersipora subatra TaxID=2589382 RepID=UPI00355BCB10